ncbi:MAG: hypothetical protein V1845_03220 [bacterium]
MSKKIQKLISVTASIATIATMSGIGMLAPMMANAVIDNIAEGALIKTAASPDVYIAKYLGAKAFKRLILSPSVFNSYGHLSWSNVKTVSQATMDQFTISTLVRAVGDPKVYNLAPVANSDNGGKHWVNMTAEQFTACNSSNALFDWDSVYQINTVDRDSYTASNDDTTCTLSTEGSGITPGTTLQVTLSPNTQPSTTIVDGSAANPLASFNLTAPSNGAVKVTTFKVKRIGVSADATLTNVYLYDGNTRITDNASVSSNIVSWNNSTGIFTIPAGTTKTITVKSDIDGTAGETIGVSMFESSYIVTDGATVTGSFPINGNFHTIASGTLGGVSFGTVTPSSDGTPSPQTEFNLWQSTVTISTRSVYLKYITFRQIGSVNTADLANFKLLVDGVQVGSTVAAMDANGYVAFDITSSPKTLQTGAREFKVLVDIVGGSTRTTSLSLRYAADVIFTDSEYASTILVQAASTTFSAQSSTAQTIAAGSLTISKATTSPSGNVTNGGSSATIAKFDLKALGEPIKIESLDIAIYTSSATANTDAVTWRNGALFADGIQVGSTQSISSDNDVTAQYTRFSLGSSLVVTPGTDRVLEIRMDIYDNDGTNQVVADWQVRGDVLASAVSNAQRTVSGTYFVSPATIKSGNVLTVKEGTITIVKYTGYTSQTAVPPKTAFKLGEWRLTSGTTEPVNLTSISPDFEDAENSILGVADLSNCYYTYADKTTSLKSTLTSSTSESFSVSYTLQPGATIPIALYCTTNTTISGTTGIRTAVGGTAANSGATANASEVLGQTITWGSGSFTTAATETPLDQLAYGGQTIEAANFDLTAASDTYTVNQIAIKFRNVTQAAVVNSVLLYDGATLLNPGGSVVDGSGISTTTGLSWQIPSNTTKTLTVKLGLNTIGTGATNAALNASTTLDTLYIYDSNGTPTYESTDREGNAVVVYKSYPTLALTSSSGKTITNNVSGEVAKFTVTPSAGGSVSLKQIGFDVAWTDAGPTVDTLELDYWLLYEGATDITAAATIKDDGTTGDATGNSGITEADTTKGLIVAFPTEKTVTTATEFTLKATPRLFDKGTTSSDSVTLTLTKDTTNLERTKLYANYPASTYWGLDDSNTGDASTFYYFIWSDRSVIPHVSTSGSVSADWFNGFLVKSLPLPSITLTP